jgi:hypothetical protein
MSGIKKYFFLLLLTTHLKALPIGIVGGDGSGTSPYAALVELNGSLLEIANRPSIGGVPSVMINSSGVGIIGVNTGFAAFVSPEGIAIPFSVPSTMTFNQVAINSSGAGIIAGKTEIPYVAMIAPDGTLTPVSGENFGDFSLDIFDQKFVKETMKERRNNDGDHYKKDNAAQKSISPSKNLASFCIENVYRSHSRKNHRRIFICLNPTHVLKVAISPNPDY